MRKTAEMFKALGEPNRFRILAALASRPACVCELSSALSLKQPNLSRHLRVLESAGLVESRRAGGWTDYRVLESARTSPVVKWVRALASSDQTLRRDARALKRADRVQLQKCKRRR
jgi:DNA-binding transcriptional ArsR family regulator